MELPIGFSSYIYQTVQHLKLQNMLNVITTDIRTPYLILSLVNT